MAMKQGVDEASGAVDITQFVAGSPGQEIVQNDDGTFSTQDPYGNKAGKLGHKDVGINKDTGEFMVIHDMQPNDKVGITMGNGEVYTPEMAEVDQPIWEQQQAAHAEAIKSDPDGGKLGVPIIEDLADAVQDTLGGATDVVQDVADKGIQGIPGVSDLTDIITGAMGGEAGKVVGPQDIGNLQGAMPGQAPQLQSPGLAGSYNVGIARPDAPMSVQAPGALGAMGAARASAPGIAGSYEVGPNLIQQQMLERLGGVSASEFAGQQNQVLQALQAQAQGRGVSPAAQMLQAERDKILASQMALAASQTGRELPAVQRQIMQQAALGQQEAAREAAILRSQEQIQAQQALLGGLGQAQQTELGRAGLSAEMMQANQQQALQAALANQQAAQQAAQLTSQRQLAGAEQATQVALANLAAQQQAQQLGSQRQMFTAEQQMQAQLANQAAQQQQAALQAQLGTREAELTSQRQQFGAGQEFAARAANQAAEQERQRLAADLAKAELSSKTQLESERMRAEAAALGAAAAQQGAMAGAGLQALGILGAAGIKASDKNVKFDIKNITKKDLSEFFKAYKPQTYKYKNSQWGEGEQIGFMIQDIEKTKLGKQIVRKVDIGDGRTVKGYDKDNLQGILMAALAHQAKKGKK